MDPEALLAELGGAARCAPLLRAGASRRALARAVAAGAVEQPAPGLYGLPGCAPAPLARAAVGGALSCLDAARLHDLVVLRPHPLVHVLAPRGSMRQWPATVVHRGVVPADGAPLSLVASLRSAARCAPLPTAVSLVDQALRAGRCTAAELASASAARDPRWRAVLAASDARAMSALESFARLELVAVFAPLGVTVQPQVRLRGVGAVDLLVDGWLVVESDGYAYHSTREQYREDRRRNQELSSHGYVWLRFSFEDVVRSGGRLGKRAMDVWSRGHPPHLHDLRER